ncbi:MAG: hypothetical protein WBW38_14050 [Candidatus Sulfotelmatobacter sp.]
MALSAADQQRIIEQESAWTDNAFGQVDLSAFPALNELPKEETHDHRFARDWRDTGLSRDAAALRQFIDDPDVESLQQVGNEIGSAEYLREVRDRKGEAVAVAFKRQNPGYIPTQHNYDTMVTTLAFNALSASQQNGTIEEMTDDLIAAGYWTPENLTACYKTLTREGLLDVPAGSTRNLSERERLHVIRLAQTGRTEEAVDQFLRYALDDDEPSIDLLTDPAYRGALDTAVMFVFETATTDYVPNEDRRSFLLHYAAGRPLTFALLSQAWQTLKAREASYARTEILDSIQRPRDSEPPSAREIDEMDDASVDRLYHDSLRAYAASIRGAGILA